MITGSSISRDGGTGSYSGVKSLVFNGGAGGNTIDLQGTSVPTRVNAGAGDDTINVGSTSNTLDTLNGTVTIDGPALALEFARVFRDDFDDVIRLECGGRSLTALAGDLATQLGL